MANEVKKYLGTYTSNENKKAIFYLMGNGTDELFLAELTYTNERNELCTYDLSASHVRYPGLTYEWFTAAAIMILSVLSYSEQEVKNFIKSTHPTRSS